MTPTGERSRQSALIFQQKNCVKSADVQKIQGRPRIFFGPVVAFLSLKFKDVPEFFFDNVLFQKSKIQGRPRICLTKFYFKYLKFKDVPDFFDEVLCQISEIQGRPRFFFETLYQFVILTQETFALSDKCPGELAQEVGS